MTLRPGSAALVMLLAILTAVGPLSTDMYLASLPAIGRAFATDAGQVQLTLSVFLVGFALGQIIYGPVADLYGRKPVLLAGLTLFVAASFFCMVATSIGALVAAPGEAPVRLEAGTALERLARAPHLVCHAGYLVDRLALVAEAPRALAAQAREQRHLDLAELFAFAAPAVVTSATPVPPRTRVASSACTGS